MGQQTRSTQPLGKHMVAVPTPEGWQVQTKRDSSFLGWIEWHAKWKQWRFVPDEHTATAYTWNCLMALSLFLADLNDGGGPSHG